MDNLYRACSGQQRRRGGNTWGICLNDPYYAFCPWWRAESANGRRLTYPTFEAAEAARIRLESKPMPEKLVAHLEKSRAARATNPAKIPVVPYSAYFSTSCWGCHADGKAPLRDRYLQKD